MSPNVWATNATRMTTTSTGATYLMMTIQAFSTLNSLEIFTSSTMAFGLMIQPTKMQVSSATIGMITELEMKSKKSSSVVPSPIGSMNDKPL